MESDIATNNAEGTCYITSPVGRATLKALLGVPHDTSGAGPAVWRDDNTINGYFASAPSNISDVCTAGGAATTGGSESGIVFAQWRDLVVGQFGCYAIKGWIESDKVFSHPEWLHDFNGNTSKCYWVPDSELQPITNLVI